MPLFTLFFLKDRFARYSVLNYLFFSLNTYKILWRCLLVSTITVEKSAVSLIVFFLSGVLFLWLL